MEFDTKLIQTIQADDARGLRLSVSAEPSLISLSDARGLTLLHYAAQVEAIECAEALIDAGSAVDAKNKWGETPLWVAVMAYREDRGMITLLLRNGANPDALTNNGKTPRQMADLIANYDVAKFFQRS